jgi:hypothetical protein
MAILLLNVAWAAMSQDVPDEPGYFAEATDIARTGQTKTYTGHSIGPAAYLGAAAIRVGELVGVNPLLTVRFTGALCVVVASWMAYGVARMTEGNDPYTPMVAAAVVGFLPMYSHLGASANADTVLVLFSAIWIFALTWLIVDGITVPGLVVLASAGLLGMLTKERFIMVLPLAAFLIVPLIGLAGTERTRRAKERVAEWAEKPVVWVIGVVAVFGIGLVVRQIQTASDLPGYVTLPLVGRFPMPGLMIDWLVENGTRTFKQYVAYFGYLHVPGPTWIYGFFTLLYGAAVIGWVVRIVRKPEVDARAGDGAPTAVAVLSARTMLAVAVVLSVYGVSYYALSRSGGTQGRYLFPVLPAVGVLTAGGWKGFVSPLMRPWFVAGGATALFAVNVYALFGILAPFFY